MLLHVFFVYNDTEFYANLTPSLELQNMTMYNEILNELNLLTHCVVVYQYQQKVMK